MLVQKAESVDQIFQCFRNQALQPDELDAYYVEADEARGGTPVRRRIIRQLEANQDDKNHLLLVGYKGCGKSTELNHLQKELDDRFLIINYSVMSELDPQHLNYIELFIVTLEKLFDLASEKGYKVSEEYLKRIQHWLSSKEIEDIKDKYISGEAEAGSESEIGIPFLQKFFLKFRLSAKSSRSLKETLKTNIEPKLSDLIDHCNTLIQEINSQIRAERKYGLLIIIEDLDKIPIDRAEDLFFNYANQLTQLKANIIFTFPITVYYHIRFNQIQPYFKAFELPMIKTHTREGTPFQMGIDLLKSIVERRMDLSLFESTDLLELLIEKSGGCIRDLFRMVTESAEQALDYERDKITAQDCERAVMTLRRDYENTIADNRRGGMVIEAQAYYDALAEVVKDATKKPANTEVLLDLRQNLCLLGYNGEGWCDVHPVVKDILINKGLVKDDTAG